MPPIFSRGVEGVLQVSDKARYVIVIKLVNRDLQWLVQMFIGA
jgi:hypothetical protein